MRDLGSTNGTFIDGQRVKNAAALEDGARLRLGSAVELGIQLRPSTAPRPPRLRPALLADLTTGIDHPVRKERIYVGCGEHCDLRIGPAGARLACITLHDDGEIWVGSDEAEFAVVPGEPFTLGGHQLVFRDGRGALASTLREPLEKAAYAYRLHVRLAGGSGPEATIHDPANQTRHVVRAENRVSLLFVLARQVLQDQREGLAPDQAGWCPDEAVMSGIWGRNWERLGPNNYQVLLFRLRKELAKADLDGWFIEKRRGRTRLRLRQGEVAA